MVRRSHALDPKLLSLIPKTIPWKPVANDQCRSFVDPRYMDVTNRADAKNNVERGAAFAVSIQTEAAKVARNVCCKEFW